MGYPTYKLPAQFADELTDMGYMHVGVIDGKYVGITGLVFGEYRLVSGLHETGWAEAWDYGSFLEASAAIKSWDGRGDPPGDWTKHRPSGRHGPGWREGFKD